MNILFGLNTKLEVLNDVKLDLKQHKDMLDRSEAARLGLQNNLQKNAM